MRVLDMGLQELRLLSLVKLTQYLEAYRHFESTKDFIARVKIVIEEKRPT